MKFVLILTFWMSGDRYIHHVPGFNSEETCNAAGERWVESAPGKFREKNHSFICAQL